MTFPTSNDSDTSTQTITMPSISNSTATTSSAGSLNSSASSSQTSSPPTSIAASSPTASFRSFSFTRTPNFSYNARTNPPSTSSLSSSPNLAADRSHFVRPTLTTTTSCSPSRSIPGSPSRRRSIQHHHSPPIVCSSPPANRPSIALSTNEPDFSFKTQPSALTRQKNSNQSAPRGKLLVKLISARHLSPPSIQSRPYVVVTFDQNEFVSREPIHEEGEEVTGTARLRTSAEREAELGLQSLQNNNGGGGGPSRSPIPDLKGRLPLPATPGGGLNPGEKGYDDRLAEQEAERLGLNPGSTASSSMLSRSPASGLGRKLEEFENKNGTPQGSPKPPKPELAPVDVNVSTPLPKGDEAKTPTGADDEPQNGFGGEKEMAYNPTWKHEVYL